MSDDDIGCMVLLLAVAAIVAVGVLAYKVGRVADALDRAHPALAEAPK